MAIPVLYNLLMVRSPWKSAVVTILGSAGRLVCLWPCRLWLNAGFRATLIATGSPENAMVRRAGATRMESAVSLDALRIIETTAGVARGSQGPWSAGWW